MPKEFSSAPGFKATVGSQTFEQVSPSGLRSLMIEDHVDMAGFCTIIVGCSETDPAWGFKIGDPVEVFMRSSDHALFKGEVISIDHSFQLRGTSSLTIRCMDNVHRLGRGRKTRFWNNMMDSDVASEVGAECGLEVEIDPTPNKHPYILQRNESNIAFLKRLASRNNLQVRVELGKLWFKKATFSGEAIKVAMGENLVSMNMAYNSSAQVQKVVVQGWNIHMKMKIVGQCTAAEVTKIGGGEIGAELSNVFGESTAYITDIPVSSQAMANEIAKSEMERLARQFCRGRCVIRGNNFMRAGTSVEFSGFSEGLNGTFYVISTRHIINPQTGYTTDFSFCSNTMGA